MASNFQDDFKKTTLPIGSRVTNWEHANLPSATPIEGTFCRLERLNATHGPALFDAYAKENIPNDWVYLPYGPFESNGEFQHWIEQHAALSDPFFYAIIDSSNDAVLGIASYLRIDPAIGSIEVGHIHFSPSLQRNAIATEAMYLMMKHVFDMGYRRYEWKCDALNARSRSAALRLGFTLEGIFRQATMYKGRNRDTAWFSVIDKEWPRIQDGFTQWLSDSNFDEGGKQQRSLSECREKAR